MKTSVVIPVYRSERILPRLVAEIRAALPGDLEIVLVNDASPDGSWDAIVELARQHPFVVGIDLRKNAGQHNAIMAGLRQARGDVVVMMDDDLQHSPADLPRFVAVIAAGADVCYSRFPEVRQRGWKILGSRFNDWVANILLKKPKGLYLSPFKAISGEIREMVAEYDGPYVYVDGIILGLTDRISVIEVEHHARADGRGGYGLVKSIRLWTMMATGFSVTPLRFATLAGFVVSVGSFLLAAALVAYRLAFDVPVEGWTSLAVITLFLGGVQLLSLGIVGEYVGRSYLRINGKRQFVVRSVVGGAAREKQKTPAPREREVS